MTKVIDSFEGRHGFLSNFHLCDVVYEGLLYPSVEHAYQAAKTLDPVLRFEFSISRFMPAGRAKKAGQRLPLRADWERVKISIMLQLLRTKFREPGLKSMLLATGDAELIEGNWWNDTFWGVCRGVGDNQLGRLLMQVREELKTGHANVDGQPAKDVPSASTR